ncbi:peptidoglycan-binding protein [Tateyamaria omphalii]|uniref:peptidoglycan-binding domain-containing protein n=1 Tax=Tateyamaria omphalii TaxID=299262 RepID=UPI001C99BE95|nr:peptidoglycan-binding domain-containing protein [Tateyamaria omphalii]MBY5933015.1 peptidoglycan-binding protein [Tateyamaria omphalii]
MFRKPIVASVLALSVAVVPASRVAADAGDFVAGAIIGGIVGAAANQNRKKKATSSRSYTKKTYKPRLPSTQEGRQIQTSLNYFGFDAGSVDGQLGQRSRNAISAYQVFLGYPATGQLTPYELSLLTGAYNRAQADPLAASQQIASLGQGSRGLLIAYRSELAGGSTTTTVGNTYGLPREVAASVNEIARSSDPSAQQLVQRSGFIQLADINGDGQTDYVIDTSVTGSAFWCNAQSCAVRVFASTPEGYERNDFQAFNVTPAMFSCQRGNCTKTDEATFAAATPAPAQPAPTLPEVQSATLPVATAIPASPGTTAVAAAAPSALPNFLGGTGSAQSLASHCNTVSLLTNTNGGFTTADKMTDPNVALNEQFCLARTYAIAKSEDMIAKVQGFTPDQIAAQCEQFGPAMQPYVAALALKSQPEVVQDVTSFILTTGMSPAQLKGTAQICMGVGYRTDNMDVALGSALMMYAMGDHVYGEIMGHHLAQGFGTAPRVDNARVWYAEGLKAVDGGAKAVFAPGQPERIELLRTASLQLGVSNSGLAPAQPTVQPAALPTFGIAAD